MVENWQFWGLASLKRNLHHFVEADIVVDCRISQNLGQCLLRILRYFLCILVGATYFNAVIRSVSEGEVGCLGSRVELVLKLLGGRKAVEFDWTWELLFVVKLFSEALRK